jgi:hypothetical protein
MDHIPLTRSIIEVSSYLLAVILYLNASYPSHSLWHHQLDDEKKTSTFVVTRHSFSIRFWNVRLRVRYHTVCVTSSPLSLSDVLTSPPSSHPAFVPWPRVVQCEGYGTLNLSSCLVSSAPSTRSPQNFQYHHHHVDSWDVCRYQ